MLNKKALLFVGAAMLLAFVLGACAGPQGPAGPAGPAGPQGPAGPAAEVSAKDLSCTECHNDTAVISAKRDALSTNRHGAGTAFAEEYGRKDCAGCHSGNAFSEMIAAGKNFSQVETGATEPGRQDCRACHQIHTTYTKDDWALETTAPVAMVVSGATFDGGAGNLCANCHQARRYLANFVAKDDAGNPIPDKYAANIRFNPHLSAQADMLVGAGDFGVEGKPGAHYTKVKDTCAGCHMGENGVHTFKPELATCQTCHTDAKDFNVNGFLTKFEEDYKMLEEGLLAKGVIVKNADGTISPVLKNADGSPLLMDPPVAQALFFYNLVEEEGSQGLHNPVYFKALMENALAAVK